MKKSIIAVSLATAFSLPAFADINIQNPIEGTPSNPIELPNPAQPIEQTPTQPQLPVQPTLPEPSHPIELPKPSHPIEKPTPSQPIEQTPTQPQLPVQPTLPEPSHPIEGDDIDVPDISGPTEAERSSALEMSFEAMAAEYSGKFKEHEEQMDGIRASLHAVTNARPFVADGEFAIGAGVGFAGSKEALALGGAYGINENLSVSGTFHYETSGKYSSSDVAGGVGLQYSFK